MSESDEPTNALARLAAPPVFVVGAPRSGTTWVYDILNVHPDVAGVYESFLFTEADGFGSLFGEIQWRDRGGERFGLGQLVSREELVLEVRRLATTWLARALEPHHRFLVEKSPSHLEVAELILELLGDARFVYVLRDGRDVVVSSRAAAKSWAKEWRAHRRLPVDLPPFGAGRAWAKGYHDALALRDRMGSDRFLMIRYEDIKRDPFPSYKQLYDFCGFDYDDDLLQRVFDATDFDTQFTGGEDQFRRGGRVGDWRRRFTIADRAAFEAGSQGALVEAGYETSRQWVVGRS